MPVSLWGGFQFPLLRNSTHDDVKCFDSEIVHVVKGENDFAVFFQPDRCVAAYDALN